ncbi:MAG: hypothetical protein AAF518_19180 [Spirochaetota bacterium]
MGEFDNTKKAIGVGGMDDKQRQAMFDKFRSAGGEVVKDKKQQEEEEAAKRKKSRTTTTRSSRSTKQGGGSGTTSKYTAQEVKSGAGGSVSSQKSRQELEAQMGNFFNRLIVKFKCWAGRVTPFGSPELMGEFVSEINLEARSSLMELRMAGIDILGNPAIAKQISKQLDALNPMYIELIGIGHKLYDSEELSSIVEGYRPNSNSPVSLSKAAPSIYSLFRKIYYLYPFQGTYKKGLITAYDLLLKIEKKPAIIYTSKKKKVAAAISAVFDRFFPRFHLAILRNESKNIPMISFYMEELLQISQEEKPGRRKAGDALPIGNAEEVEEKTEKAEEKEEEEEKTEEVLEDHVKLGLDLMARNTPDQLRAKHDAKKEYAKLPIADKALLAYLYFAEFEYEYSFVFTTKKIEYKVTTEKTSKVDNRQKLLDVYESSRGILDHVKRYLEAYDELIKTKDNPGANYIDASKKATQMEQKRIQHSRNVRGAILEFCEGARTALKRITEDISGKQNIVGNPDDDMVFDSIESKKRLNRTPIKQCIQEAYAYSSALAERLIRGELYGGVVELTPEEMADFAPGSSGGNTAPGNNEKLLGNDDQLASLDLD